MVAERESAQLAKRLIQESYQKQDIVPGQVMLHSDRGATMKSFSLAMLLAILGVTKSFSRPHVSDDNPFSESQFKTLKYCPGFPDRFGSIQDAITFCRQFFGWYNTEHRHSSLALLSPGDVHYGRAGQIIGQRQSVMDRFYESHPERFVKGPPRHPVLASEVWINPPNRNKTREVAQGATLETPANSKGTPVFNTYGDSSEMEIAAARGVIFDPQGGDYT